MIASMKRTLRQLSPSLFQSLKTNFRASTERLRLACPRLARLGARWVHAVSGRAFKEDYYDLWTCQRDELTPPLRHLFDGTSSYEEFHRLGAELLRLLVASGLQPEQRVLEVGSGNGKNARALAGFLRAPGGYEGFDVVAAGVDWCQRQITPRHPHCRFQHADIANRTYNPAGRESAVNYRFPCNPATFDLVFLTSVFTHITPAGLENYVAEIARVLRPGGKCFASFFLLTPESLAGMHTAEPGRTFPHEFAPGVCRVADLDWPEDAVAYEQEYVRERFARHGLRVATMQPGCWWRGPANAQDLLWFAKE